MAYPFQLPDLGYPHDALEPHVDARTMEIHYSKHHQGYTNKLNAALEAVRIAVKYRTPVILLTDTWTSGAIDAQPLIGADHLSSEFSVTPMPDGRYLLVFSYDDAFGTRIAARYANSPRGPGPAPWTRW